MNDIGGSGLIGTDRMKVDRSRRPIQYRDREEGR
jgi:hypothetical protein